MTLKCNLKDYTFKGELIIDLEILENLNQLILNQKNLSNFDVSLVGTESLKIDNIEFNEKEE